MAIAPPLMKNGSVPAKRGAAILTDCDQEILNEPYAEVLLDMNYKPEVILHAVGVLRKRQAPVAAEALLREIMAMESKGRADALPRETLKRPAAGRDRYRSDGESEEESLESNSSLSSMTPKDDLQEDGGAPLVSMLDKSERFDVMVQEPPEKKPTRGKKVCELRHRLQTLREENRQLKERQLCKSCHSKPVSITFLPCGHYSFCFECGQSFNSCPICRKTILADVRTFLA